MASAATPTEAAPPRRAPRVRDAATLILYRRDASGLRVLMGRRHDSHRFLPNHFVFPGGRVDATDWRVRAAGELRPWVAERLSEGCTAARARALAAAAVRETFEETGLILGRPDPRPGAPVPANWQPFFATGFAPALDTLAYVYRAVTPPYRPVRYDARFFVADATAAAGTLGDSRELLELAWLTVEEAGALELPNITKLLMSELPDLVGRCEADVRRVITRRYLHGRFVVSEA